MKRQFISTVAAATVLGAAAMPAHAEDTIRMAFIDPLSGPFAATGSTGLKEFQFFADQINQNGGVMGKKLEVIGFDNKISPKESLIQLKRVIGEGIQFVFQGNSSGVANALTDAINKHNKRNPEERVLFLNYSAVDPALTNDKCNFWHFRFDANADMKMKALAAKIGANEDISKVYVLGQDYSFGKAVAAAAAKYVPAARDGIEIVGSELHPIGKVKDFTPYIAKVKSAGADAVITGNWGADMVGLAKAAADSGLDIPMYTYYASKTGITKAIGAGGVNKVRLVHEGADNPAITDEWRAMQVAFKEKHPDADFTQNRISNALAMTAKAIEKAGSTEPLKVAMALEGMEHTSMWGDKLMMRKSDHQIQLPLRISVHTDKDVVQDGDNSGFGLVTEATIPADVVSTETTCKMKRPKS
ncbi:MAG: branched-chain amino acid ABC transporter substrate-binding protein [Burkholderiaceae bacterium]